MNPPPPLPPSRSGLTRRRLLSAREWSDEVGQVFPTLERSSLARPSSDVCSEASASAGGPSQNQNLHFHKTLK